MTVCRLVSRIVLLLLILLCTVSRVSSIIANPDAIDTVEEGGVQYTLRLKGDAFFHYDEDEDGQKVVKAQDGHYYYAQGFDQSGELVPSTIRLGGDRRRLQEKISPEVVYGLEMSAQAQRMRHSKLSQRMQLSQMKSGRKLATTTGQVKNLVIPILFSDHVGRSLPAQSDIDQIWNVDGGHPVYSSSTGASIREYFLEQSYGQLEVTSTVLDWIEVSNTEAYYGNGNSGLSTLIWDLLTEALTSADALVDFSDYDQDGDGYIDMISFMHSGYGAEYGGTDAYGQSYSNRIWSHKWSIPTFTSEEGTKISTYHIETALDGKSGSQVTSIGVGAHESGHFFGLPDLYDTDGSSSGISTLGLMANSWGWDYSGEVPPSLSAWSKYKLGWISPVEITGAGSFSMEQIQESGEAYIIKTLPFSDTEYLLVENRGDTGFDRQAPAAGLLVWHIDEMVSTNKYEGHTGQTNWPTNGNHYRVACLQADGEFDLEKGYSADAGDFFTGGETLYAGTSLHPSSLSYQDGVVQDSGISFHDISGDVSGVFSFSVTFDASGPTSGPTVEQSSGPTVNIETCGENGVYCGGKSAGACWCDSACTSYGDCCSDYAEKCAEPTAQPTTTLEPSTTRPATTDSPTKVHTEVPTDAPTDDASTKIPTEAPTNAPTAVPTKEPTEASTKVPTEAPTNAPTAVPTKEPTEAPTNVPTNAPTTPPTKAATIQPTSGPTVNIETCGENGVYCGGKSAGACWCDSLCTSYGDCCSDYTEKCAQPTVQPTGPATTLAPTTAAVFDDCWVGKTTLVDSSSVKADVKCDVESTVTIKYGLNGVYDLVKENVEVVATSKKVKPPKIHELVILDGLECGGLVYEGVLVDTYSGAVSLPFQISSGTCRRKALRG
eukprot:CAMPEP_0206369746 /NCGR_PEP_ID=MMETSP0294-20121207/5488_1 /ASSEMBLY_ACC=CAM_ASM_000327 /TAXON_ID=39354 /ORGANISM="Heterosigma akashiwo, Strain CCMP2393" /LENGTH=885 /DNA_ID=CAMNT_0053816575 /DNA_START=279 /DNA_END=2936 /DNA_ORIENTATION=+